MGKRDLKVPEASLTQALTTVLDGLAAEHPAPTHQLVALSALALGSDTLFAETCAVRGHLQQVYLPEPASRFFGKSDFGDDDKLLKRSHDLLKAKNVIEVRVASRADDRDERFAEAGFEIAAECDVLIVACTREEAEAALATPPVDVRRGGSAETLRHAWRLGRRLFIIELDQKDANNNLTIRPVMPPAPAAAAPAPHAGPDFFSTEPPPALPDLDFHAALDAIKKRASVEADRAKAGFVKSGQFVLLVHILATFVAAGAVVFHPEDWLSIGLALLKFCLLLSGFWVAVVLHHRHNQRLWLRARLIAEICRSTIALLGKPGTPAFPGSLHHLRDFHLAELAPFSKSLNILFLREVHRQARDPNARETVQAFAEAYVATRLNHPDPKIGQIAYYEKEARAAAIERLLFDCFFFAFAGTATVLAGAALIWHSHQEWWWLLALKFLPLTLPVAAAGVVGWIALRDLDRKAERYTEMVKVLRSLSGPLLYAETRGQLRRGVRRVEHTLLQEVVEWYAKMTYHRAG